MKKQFLSLLKFALAGAIIFGIGTIVVITDEKGEVEEAQADIADWVSYEAMVDGNFGKLVEGSGLKPRAYELNGNQVFFGVAYSRNSPEEILDTYQQAFVDAGINDKKFLEVPEAKFHNTVENIRDGKVKWTEGLGAYNEAMLNGGVVPITRRPGYVAMGGMVPENKAKNLGEVVGDFAGPFEGFEGKMSGFRFIDAQQMHPDAPTRITSVWADEGFSFDKMSDPNQAGVAPVVDAPACMGCEVGTVMRSLSPDEPYRIAHYYGQKSPRHLMDFYNRTMASRGWEPTDATKAVEYARQYIGGVPDARVMSYHRDNEITSITVYPWDGGTSVTVVESE